MAQATRVVRLVRAQKVRSQGVASSHARVVVPIEGPPEATGLLLELIMSRVRGETGTPGDSISFRHRDSNLFEVSGPADFVDRLTAQREVDVCSERGSSASLDTSAELDR